MQAAASRCVAFECSAPVKAQAVRRLWYISFNAFMGAGFRAPAGQKPLIIRPSIKEVRSARQTLRLPNGLPFQPPPEMLAISRAAVG